MKLLFVVSSAVQGAGIELIELICLALSILSRLLQLSPEAALSSPMVSTLSTRPSSHTERHLVSVVAQYIYHRHDSRLPTLATKLLSSLSVVSRDPSNLSIVCYSVSQFHLSN